MTHVPMETRACGCYVPESIFCGHDRLLLWCVTNDDWWNEGNDYAEWLCDCDGEIRYGNGGDCLRQGTCGWRFTCCDTPNECGWFGLVKMGLPVWKEERDATD